MLAGVGGGEAGSAALHVDIDAHYEDAERLLSSTLARRRGSNKPVRRRGCWRAWAAGRAGSVALQADIDAHYEDAGRGTSS